MLTPPIRYIYRISVNAPTAYCVSHLSMAQIDLYLSRLMLKLSNVYHYIDCSNKTFIILQIHAIISLWDKP